MARTPSTMLELGTPAPEFSLPDPLTGRTVTLAQLAGAPALLVVFMCNHCPFVKHIQRELAALIAEYQPQGLVAVGISSNDATSHPDDGPEQMAAEARRLGYTFPYLYDETQAVAKAYRAACTPDFYLFDRDRRLVYRGQFDASRPGNEVPVTGEDLRAAVVALLAGEALPEQQLPSLGCNIKWRTGNEPDYYG